tara:strand:- start:80 stop:643 length:564 start_codon:yes stop_codon:yes gene_type:complete
MTEKFTEALSGYIPDNHAEKVNKILEGSFIGFETLKNSPKLGELGSKVGKSLRNVVSNVLEDSQNINDIPSLGPQRNLAQQQILEQDPENSILDNQGLSDTSTLESRASGEATQGTSLEETTESAVVNTAEDLGEETTELGISGILDEIPGLDIIGVALGVASLGEMISDAVNPPQLPAIPTTQLGE